MKRILCAMACCVLLLCALAALAEETPRYSGTANGYTSIRESPSEDAPRIGAYNAGDRVVILDYTLEWLFVEKNGVTGYLPRNTVIDFRAPRDADVPPFGSIPYAYIATIAHTAYLYAQPTADAEPLFTLQQGSVVALERLDEGWARLVFNRVYGYVHVSALQSLEPIYPDAATTRAQGAIAAYTTFYALTEDDLNVGRITNIRVACVNITGTIAPEKRFSFNEVAGPFRRNNGYELAPVFVDGTSVAGYGGGTCQVSTTLFCALLPLGDVEIVARRTHGRNGAPYAPIGCDAAVGTQTIDFVFRSHLPFPIRLEAIAHHGVLTIALYRAGEDA